MKKFFIFFICAFILTSCNSNKSPKQDNTDDTEKTTKKKDNTNSSGWSDADMEKAVKDCINTSDNPSSSDTRTWCTCIMDKAQTIYDSYKDVPSDENKNHKKTSAEQEKWDRFQALSKDCMKAK